jgi:hypothetical protein
MRALLALGGLGAALGVGLLGWGVRQQVAWSECQVRCAMPRSWPVPVGILLLVGGGFLAAWTAAAGHAGRALHPARHEIEERERLRRVGLSGTARILRSRETGISPLGDPLVEVDLAVEVDGRVPYEVRQRTAVPRRRLGRLHAGRSVPVLVDPHDPQTLVVEWAQRAMRRSG